MDELTIVANVAIVFGVIYKLFELFVGRKRTYDADRKNFQQKLLLTGN